MSGKKLLILLLAALLVFTAVGCSSENAADTEAVMAALDKFAACKSFTIVQLTEFQETVSTDGVEAVYNCSSEKEIALQTEPEIRMVTSTVDSVEIDGDSMEQVTLSYIVTENGAYTEYFTDGSDWYKLSTEDASALEGISASSMTDAFYAGKLNYRKAGEDTLASGKALRYDGRLEGKDLLGMLSSSGYLGGVASMSANQQTKIMENLVKDLDGLTVSVWVDVDSGYPVLFRAEMSEVMKDVNKSINKSLGNKTADSEWGLGDYVISMSIKDFDAVGEIVLPAEHKTAKEIETE